MHTHRDWLFLSLVLALVAVGSAIFVSASFGLLARPGASFELTAQKQLIGGVLIGLLAMISVSKINYKRWRMFALPIFLIGIILTALVFVPGIGFRSGGAARWIHLLSFTIQPSEFLKFGFVLFLAAVFSKLRRRVNSFSAGFSPFLVVLAVVTVLFLKQPDTGTLGVFIISGLAMFLVAGGWWRYVFGLCAAAFLGLILLASMKPYVFERIATFLDPSRDVLGASYQLRQALLAVGSGQLFGRGFGQSVQKFNFLPEPTGDSIFAVAAEEFGFAGSSLIVLLFLAFGLRGIRIAARSPDQFGRLVVVGFTMLIVSQSFVNIASILGLVPLTGVPLLFISHGGTALLMALLEVGVILNVSKYRV